MSEEELEYWLNFVIAEEGKEGSLKDDGQGTKYI